MCTVTKAMDSASASGAIAAQKSRDRASQVCRAAARVGST